MHLSPCHESFKFSVKTAKCKWLHVSFFTISQTDEILFIATFFFFGKYIIKANILMNVKMIMNNKPHIREVGGYKIV